LAWRRAGRGIRPRGITHLSKLHIFPAPRRPLAWLEDARDKISTALAPIVGQDALGDLFIDFDDALTALKRE
jgi:hypothetical protein